MEARARSSHRVYLRRVQAVSLQTTTEFEWLARLAFWHLLHSPEAEDADVAWSIDRKTHEYSPADTQPADRLRLAHLKPPAPPATPLNLYPIVYNWSSFGYN